MDTAMTSGKGLTKSQQENNIIMATRRQEEEHPTPKQRARELLSRFIRIQHPSDFDTCLNTLTAIIRENEELKAANIESAKLDGSWMDKFGACRVCGGEIPCGHRSDCDLYKMESERDSFARIANYFTKIINDEAAPLEDLAQRSVAYVAKLETERDSYREKAEALDWWEANRDSVSADVVYVGDSKVKVCLSLCENGFWGKRIFGDSLLSVIQQARKETK
jgi:hypothetical protein